LRARAEQKEGLSCWWHYQGAARESVTAEAATMTASVEPRELPTTYSFEYGTTTAYGQTTSVMSLPSEVGEQSVTSALSGLEPCTTYHYQVETENEANEAVVSLGGDQSFTTGCGGVISRFAGDEHLPSSLGARKDGGFATEAGIDRSISLATGPEGSVYIGEKGWGAVRKVNSEGVISTVAGKPEGGWGEFGNPADEGSATSIHIGWPWGLATSSDGTLYIADADDQVIRAVSPEGALTTYAGMRPAINGEVGEHGTTGPCNAHEGLYSGDGGPAHEAGLATPGAVAVGSDGSLYIADSAEDAIRKVASDGEITTFGGFYNAAEQVWFEYFEFDDPGHLACEFYSYQGAREFAGDGGPATSATLGDPEGVAVGSDGSVYIAEGGQNVVRRIEPDGTITTFAGDGTAGYSGDGGPATSAELDSPGAVAVGPEGSVYVADTCNAVVRRISPLGTITTVAGGGGNGEYGYAGQATSAKLEGPGAIALDEAGNLFIAGGFSSGSGGEVLKVDAPLGPGSTIDSGGGAGCHSGGGGAD
jgi:streptogramin lyase